MQKSTAMAVTFLTVAIHTHKKKTTMTVDNTNIVALGGQLTHLV